MNKSESKYFNTAVKMDKAMIEILEKKDFEYITVKEVCEKAGVNRSTFYLHYGNTYDLLEETGKYLENDFFSYFSAHADKNNEKKLIDMISAASPDELNYLTADYLHPFLTYVFENKRVFFTVLSQGKAFNVDGIFEMMFEHFFNPILSKFNYPEKYRKLVMMFYLNGIIAIVKEWLNGNCTETIAEVSDIINICVHGLNQDFETRIKKYDIE